MTRSPDLTVHGAGIFGLACAWEAARRGARVRVIDPGGIGAGASGGQVGALAPHAPDPWNAKKAFQRDSLLAAEAFFSAAEAAGGAASGYRRTGRVQPAPDPAALAARIAASAERWPAPFRLTETPPGPLVPASRSGWWLVDDLTARIAPKAALACLAAAIRARGGAIVGDGAPAGPALWATGAAGLAELGAGRGVKGQSALLAFDAGPDAPQVLADGLHIVPHGDGTVAIGSTTEPDAADPAPDAGALALVARARALVPALADAPVIATWAGSRPRAASRAPLLGPWPGRPGQFVANGGFKIGFGVAPGVARVMADLILDGVDAIPAGFRLG